MFMSNTTITDKQLVSRSVFQRYSEASVSGDMAGPLDVFRDVCVMVEGVRKGRGGERNVPCVCHIPALGRIQFLFTPFTWLLLSDICVQREEGMTYSVANITPSYI